MTLDGLSVEPAKQAWATSFIMCIDLQNVLALPANLFGRYDYRRKLIIIDRLVVHGYAS